MLAFSQVSASGTDMTTAVKAMEAEIQEKKAAEKNKNGGLEYDDAVAAYAEFMSGEGSEAVDPNIEL